MRSTCRLSTWLVLLPIACAASAACAQDKAAGKAEVLIGKIEGIEHARVASVAFTPSGKSLVSGGNTYDPILRFWDPETMKPQRTADGGHRGEVFLAFSKGGVLVSADSLGTLVVWNADYTAPKWTTKQKDYAFGKVDISPDGAKVATVAHINSDLKTGYELAIWDVKTEKRLHTMTDFQSFVRCVAFSPDGKLIACAADTAQLNGDLRVYDVATGKLRWSNPKAHQNAIEGVKFAPVGGLLATGSADETIKLWEAATGRGPVVLEGSKEFVNDVAFSPNGKLLASTGEDKNVHLWSVPDGRLLQSLGGHTGEVHSVAFSPDGTRVASGGDDQTVRVWPIGVGEANGPAAKGKRKK